MQAEENSPELVARSRDTLDIIIAIGWIILFFVLQLIGGVIAIGVAMVISPPESLNQADIMTEMSDLKFIALPTLWGLIGSSLTTIALLWLYIRRNNRWTTLGLDRWSNLSLARTLIIAVALITIGLGFNYLYTTYVIPDIKVQDDVRRIFAAIPKNTFNNFLLLFTVAVLAPITEELLFRGLLQRSLAQKTGPALAIILASAIFAAIHMDYYAFPALFVLGSAFGILYHVTGSMRVNIAMHVINNAAALLLTQQ